MDKIRTSLLNTKNYLASHAGVVVGSVSASAAIALPIVASAATSVQSLVDNASSSFQTTTGMGLDGVVSWMWTNLVEPIFGAGILSIYVLRYPLIALALLMLVIFFGFKAWHAWRGH